MGADGPPAHSRMTAYSVAYSRIPYFLDLMCAGFTSRLELSLQGDLKEHIGLEALTEPARHVFGECRCNSATGTLPLMTELVGVATVGRGLILATVDC